MKEIDITVACPIVRDALPHIESCFTCKLPRCALEFRRMPLRRWLAPIMLRWQEGMGVHQIALELGISDSTVRRRLRKMDAYLRVQSAHRPYTARAKRFRDFYIRALYYDFGYPVGWLAKAFYLSSQRISQILGSKAQRRARQKRRLPRRRPEDGKDLFLTLAFYEAWNAGPNPDKDLY
jgi:hypothetical protein